MGQMMGLAFLAEEKPWGGDQRDCVEHKNGLGEYFQ